MSVDKLVDSTQLDSDLTDVADEIRTAGGTLLPLSFPDDYVVAIGDIGNTEIKTASGSIAHFEDALARKAQNLTVAIEPVQSGSGDPSPDNVRPISGRTGANIHVSPTTDAADGTTYSITFPTEAGTVYGGTLDVTTGKLTVDRAVATFDGSNDEVWTRDGQNKAYTQLHALKKESNYSLSIKCDKLRPVSNQVYVGNTDYSISGYYDYGGSYPNRNWVYLKVTNAYDSAASIREWLAGNPVTITYPLATPIVYDLDPVTVTTLLGTNNVWADTGDSTIKYIAPKAQIPSASGVSF